MSVLMAAWHGLSARRKTFASRERLLRAAVAAAMLFALLAGDRGLIRLIRLLHDRAAIKGDIRELAAKQASLEAELAGLTTDPAKIEKLAREQLDMARRGETVYKFPSR